MICIHFGCGRLCFKEGRMRFIEVPIYMPLLISEDSVLFHQHISHFSIETLQALLRQHNFIIEKYDETGVLHVKVRKAERGLG